jgi:hypothetical protein
MAQFMRIRLGQVRGGQDLAGVELDYLLLDAAQFKLHPGAPTEPVLCAWGRHHLRQPGAARAGPGQ